MLSSSHAISSCNWAVLWVASKAVGARESVRLAAIIGGGMWSKMDIQGAFWLCLRPYSGLKSSVFSSFLRWLATTINPYRRPSTTRNVIFRTRVSDGDFRGRREEPNIRMEGGGVVRGGIGRISGALPAFSNERD